MEQGPRYLKPVSLAKTVSGSLDGCLWSCPAVGLARWDEILEEVQRASQKEEKNG